MSIHLSAIEHLFVWLAVILYFYIFVYIRHGYERVNT